MTKDTEGQRSMIFVEKNPVRRIDGTKTWDILSVWPLWVDTMKRRREMRRQTVVWILNSTRTVLCRSTMQDCHNRGANQESRRFRLQKAIVRVNHWTLKVRIWTNFCNELFRHFTKIDLFSPLFFFSSHFKVNLWQNKNREENKVYKSSEISCRSKRFSKGSDLRHYIQVTTTDASSKKRTLLLVKQNNLSSFNFQKPKFVYLKILCTRNIYIHTIHCTNWSSKLIFSNKENSFNKWLHINFVQMSIQSIHPTTF